MPDNIESYGIRIYGRVQGVGFRPFVYRLATKYHLAGWVKNTNECVEVHVRGAAENLGKFIRELRNDPPEAADVERVDVAPGGDPGTGDFFRIIRSEDRSDRVTEISPDIAVCKECMADLDNQSHRIHYPFINCSQCGPRFSIIRSLPYDRGNTTMAPFGMCSACRKEYSDVTDRRFHAQPVACNECGPRYILYTNGRRKSSETGRIIESLSKEVKKGKIIALKGIGGFHLACDAFNPEAVERLRQRKLREVKPFAVMFRDMDAIREVAFVSGTAERCLLSWRRPIVLLDLKPEDGFPSSVSSGLSTVGAFLPYTPFHHLFFGKLNTPALVMTSGNVSDEPIVIDDREARIRFKNMASSVVTSDREIFNRTDDSVVRIINGKERLFRRSRGYVPEPVRLTVNADGILATGAELVNCFCIGKGENAILSQHIGDLKDHRTLLFYEETIDRFRMLFRYRPLLVACDMHPDYFSTRFAESSGLPVTRVQHHHAHIASCMAEHGLDEKVIGVALDGTGYGTDGNTWGAEFLVSDLSEFIRYAHFDYIPLPGGDRGTKEPWRTAVSYLYRIYGQDLVHMDLPFISRIGKERILQVIGMIEKNINCPLVSSAGRAFDAAAALTGLCLISKYEAEAPMRLESALSGTREDPYPFQKGPTISLLPLFQAIAEDVVSGTPVSRISARFHRTIISIIFETVKMIREQEKISAVVLSGGVFQNAFLLTGIEKLLSEEGFKVYSQNRIPPNDGGIALGQLVIAAKRRSLGCV